MILEITNIEDKPEEDGQEADAMSSHQGEEEQRIAIGEHRLGRE
jgi:hypothetical protein